MAAFDDIGVPTPPTETGGDESSESSKDATPSSESSKDATPSTEKLVAPIKPAQPVLGSVLPQGEDFPSLQLEGSCGDDIKDYGSCYLYNFERFLSSYTLSSPYTNVLKTAHNSANETTNVDRATVGTFYNDGADVTFSSNAQDSNYTNPNTQKAYQLRKIPSYKDYFSSYPDNKFNILEPSINFAKPPEGQSVEDDEREENCARTTANLLYNKKRRNNSVESDNNLDPALIKPFESPVYAGTNATFKAGAWDQAEDSLHVERNDGFCFIAKLPNVGSYGTIKIKFTTRLGTSGYTPFIFNNNIANGFDSGYPLLEPRDYHSTRSAISSWHFNVYRANDGTVSFDKKYWTLRYPDNKADVGEDDSRPYGQREGYTFLPQVYRLTRSNVSVMDGDGKVQFVYDGVSPELLLHSSHLGNGHVPIINSSDGHVDTYDYQTQSYTEGYTKVSHIKKPLLNELNFANFNSTVALDVSYNLNTKLGRRLADPHYYNDQVKQFVREANVRGWTFAPLESGLPFIQYSNGLHSNICHLWLNRSETYRPYQQWPPFNYPTTRLFGTEQLMVTYRSLSQRWLNWSQDLSSSFSRGGFYDKPMSGYSSTGKYTDGRTQYYRNHLGYQNGSKMDYPRADIMRADLTQKHYEIIIYKGKLNYDITGANIGRETHGPEEFGGASEDFVEYFRFRTHGQSNEGREISNYNINQSTNQDSQAQFEGAANNAPNGQSEGTWTERDMESNGVGTNGLGSARGYEVSYPNTNVKDGIAISPDGDYFVINFSENFIHENKEELGHLRVAVIQDVIEVNDSRVATFSDASRANGGTGISVNPVFTETLSIVTNDEIGLGNNYERSLGSPLSHSTYLPQYGQGGFIDGQAEVDEHKVNLYAINNGISVAAARSAIANYIGEPSRISSGTDRGAPIYDYDYKCNRLPNLPFPVSGGYINLFTTSNWLAVKMLWARYGGGDTSWRYWGYNPREAEAQGLYGDRYPITYYYYEPWKLEIEYTTKATITHLDTKIDPRCSSDRKTFQSTPSTALANMPYQCGECLNKDIPEEVYEGQGYEYEALEEGFPAVDQKDTEDKPDNRNYIAIKDNG